LRGKILVSNCSEICLEMLYVYCIESDYSDVQTNISFSEFVAKEIFPRRFGENIFETIERFEEWENIIFVRFLSSSKSAFVNSNCQLYYDAKLPIINSIVNPGIHLVNLFGEFRRIKR